MPYLYYTISNMEIVSSFGKCLKKQSRLRVYEKKIIILPLDIYSVNNFDNSK